MTVSSTVTGFGPFSTNGSTTSFAFTFRLDPYGGSLAKSQVEVIKVTTATGAESTLVLDSDYTVSLNGDQDASPGGSIVISPALATGYKIYGRKLPVFTQQTELENQAAYNADDVESEFDHLQGEILWLKDAVRRSPVAGIQAGPSFSGAMNTLPAAGQVPIVNSDASGFIFGTPVSSAVSTAMLPVVQAATLNAAAAAFSFAATGSSTARSLADAIGRPIITTNLLDATITSRWSDIISGKRGPMFIWNNLSPSDHVAGQSAGLQIWIGDNPTATPSLGDIVPLTVINTNDNGRATLWGANFACLQNPLGTDGILHGVESEIATTVSEQTDPFTNAGNPRKNAYEAVHHTASTKRGTAAYWAWSAASSNAGWWSNGVALARIADVGIYAAIYGADTATDSFRTAFIYDNTQSAAVLKVANAHATVFNLATLGNITNFILGRSGSASNLNIRNNADYEVAWSLDSGTSAAQQSRLALLDRGTEKWSVIKNTSNNVGFYNHALTASALVAAIATNNLALAGDVIIGSDTPAANGLGVARGLTIYSPGGSAGLLINANGALRGYISADTSYLQMITATAIPLSLGVNNAVCLTINASGDSVIASGKKLQLGNAYAAGAIVATGSLILYDNAGTAYKVAALAA